MADDPAIAPYDKPAGGLDALRSSWHALRAQDVLLKGSQTLLRTNQPTGFDCPGCAWPDRNAHSTFEFCENGVKAVANEATSKRVLRTFFAAHTVSELAAWNDRDLEGLGRLTEPMAYDAASDRYVPIAWDDAFARIAMHLQALASPDEAIFYTSGRTSNEAAFLYQLFVRAFGTNNLPDCSNMCHEPSGVAMGEQLGSGKGSVLLDDFALADAIFVFGQNPGTNHPRMLGELRSAAKRGCRIVAFNPLRERGLERFADPKSPVDLVSGGVQLASLYFQPRIGGDLALLTGIARVVVERDAVDHAFIDAHTTGFDAFATSVRGTDWADIERESGLSRADVERAAQAYIDSNAAIFCWGMGITQHARSVATIQLLVDVLLLRGNIGRPGAGPCPVRGHSNVQGDRTMGIFEKMSDAFLDRLGDAFGFTSPRAHGFDTIAAIEAMRDGRARVFFAMGGNFATATPDTAVTQAALRRCALTAHVSTKLNRSHLVHGRDALILPCLGRTEIDLQASGPQAVTVEDSMSMVHLSAGMNLPASDALLSEPAIVARLAQATLPDSRIPWAWLAENYDRIRDRIAQVVEGFEDFNTRVRTPGGFHLHHPNRERLFPNASGKAEFHVHALSPHTDGGAPRVHADAAEMHAHVDPAPVPDRHGSDKQAADEPLSPRERGWGEGPEHDDAANRADPSQLSRPQTAPDAAPLDATANAHSPTAAPFQLMTIRSHDQYNTTVYGLDDRYRGVKGLRHVCFISRADLTKHGFADGDHIDLVSVWHDGERVAEAFRLVAYDIPAGCLAAYYPETNGLVPLDHHAEHARTPASKSIPVRLRRRG